MGKQRWRGCSFAAAEDDAWGSGRASASTGATTDPFGGSESIWNTGSDPFGSGFGSPTESASDRSAAPPPAYANRSTSKTNIPEDVDFGSSEGFRFDEEGSFFDGLAPSSSAPSMPSVNAFEDEFMFDDVGDDLSDPFAEVDAGAKKAKKGKKAASAALSGAWSALPAQFVPTRPNRRALVLLGVLVILNVLALVGLLLA
ncbi:MAG: hypothetical protein HC915_20890 [Anaerolineae bacterium]|nr:hypothetical protein [Anaerolineae bacterium]